jgi:ribosomal protein S18 acetylase RimI-like enzyme
MRGYSIRPANDTSEERKYIDGLNFDSFRVAFQLHEDITDEEAYRRYRKIEDEDPLDPFGENHIVFIMQTGEDERAGLILLEKREPFYAFKEPLVWIYNINIEPKHRGKRLAVTLLEQAEKWTKENGYTQIGLHVIQNNSIARRLYSRHGYKQVAQHDTSCFYLKTL